MCNNKKKVVESFAIFSLNGWNVYEYIYVYILLVYKIMYTFASQKDVYFDESIFLLKIKVKSSKPKLCLKFQQKKCIWNEKSNILWTSRINIIPSNKFLNPEIPKFS